MRPKYAIHPGKVKSRTDGDIHYIKAGQLARLYDLKPHEWFRWDNITKIGKDWDDYVHLYPSYEGNYGRPKEG